MNISIKGTSSRTMEAGTQTGLSEEEKAACYKEDYADAIFKLLDNIKMQNAELYWEIIIESLFKHFARENRGKGSEKPDLLGLDKEEMKHAREEEEFENYLTLLKEVRARFGHDIECIVILYIMKHKGEAYWRNLCISRSHKEK